MKPISWICLLIAIFTGSIALGGDGGAAAAVAFLIDRDPGHNRKGDTAYAAEIGAAMEKAGAQYEVDPYLLTSMGFWESHFRPDVLSLKKKGPAGEEGVLQCGKQCKAACDHFMDDVEGQALCGASWYHRADQACSGGERAALTYYASGAACRVEDYRPESCRDDGDVEACYKHARGNLRAKVSRRLQLAKRLRNRFGQ